MPQYTFPFTLGIELRQDLFERHRVYRLQQVVDHASDRFGARKAIQPFGALIPIDNTSLEIPDDDRLERQFNQQAELFLVVWRQDRNSGLFAPTSHSSAPGRSFSKGYVCSSHSGIVIESTDRLAFLVSWRRRVRCPSLAAEIR